VTVDALAREYDALIHFTPTVAQRKVFAKQGVAMPGGSFYIRNASDLDNAIAAVGRATPNANESETSRRNAVRRHIMERARFLKLESRIPDTWNSDGTLKHSKMQGLHADFVILDEVIEDVLSDLMTDEFLEHFGVKGMRWGVRGARSTGITPSHTAPRSGKFPSRHVPASRRVGMPKPHHPVATDAAKTLQLKSQLSKHGPQSLSNQDLQHLVKRMQLENQLRQLDPVHKTAGRKVVDEAVKIGGNAAKQTAAQFAAKYAAEGAAHLIKLAIKMK
jgi:hypothetical protein